MIAKQKAMKSGGGSFSMRKGATIDRGFIGGEVVLFGLLGLFDRRRHMRGLFPSGGYHHQSCALDIRIHIDSHQLHLFFEI